jgi:hypothetical protein
VVIDNVKHRKACSKRLKQVFRIANYQAADAIPVSGNTLNTWIKREAITRLIGLPEVPRHRKTGVSKLFNSYSLPNLLTIYL